MIFIKLFIVVMLSLFLTFAFGVGMDTLKPCPMTPNCVSSLEEKKSPAYVEPFLLHPHLPIEHAMSKLETLIRSYPRTKIIQLNDNYLHAEFKTFLGFIDDVECLIDSKNRLLHIRSASRIGYSDLGKNRRRYQDLKKHLSHACIIESSY